MRIVIILILLPIISWSQGLIGPAENLGLYGGFTWDYEISEYQGQQIIFTAQNGGNQIYYSVLEPNEHPKNIKWKKLPATNLSKTALLEAHNLNFHSKSGTLFWMQGTERLLSAKLNDEFAKPLDDFKAIEILGDTLIAIMFQNRERLLSRYYINKLGELQLLGHDTIKSWNIGFTFHINPKSKQVLLPGRDSILISEKGYSSTEESLGFKKIKFKLANDSLLQDPVFHINDSGDWLILQSQNYFSPWFGTDDSITYPRILSRSNDLGESWQSETVEMPWPIAHLMPPNISSTETRGREVITAGSLYRLQGGNWKVIGHKNPSPRIYIYDGVSAIHPNNPRWAFHASNIGPVISSAFGDSIYPLNQGIDAILGLKMNYYPKSRSLITSSYTGISLLLSAGLPQERWLRIPQLTRFNNKEISVAYDEKRNRVYASDEQLYAYDLDSEKWQLIMKPSDVLENLLDQEIVDITVNPWQPNMLACLVEAANYTDNYILYSRDAGKTWDSIEALGSFYWFSRADWRKEANHYELRFGYSNDHTYHPYNNKVNYYHITDSTFLLEQENEALTGLGWLDDIRSFKSSNANNVPNLAILKSSGNHEMGSFQLMVDTGSKWDTLKGPSIPKCFNCYNSPRAVVGDENYAFVGAGHHLYAFDLRKGQGKLIGEIYSYPRLENIRELEIIDNHLYVLGEYGVYRQKLNYKSEPNNPIEAWSLFPNPSTGLLKLQPPSPFSVYNLAGIKVYQSKDSQYQADLSDLEPGLYLIKVPEQEGKLWRKL